MVKGRARLSRRGGPRLVDRRCVVCEWRGEVTEHGDEIATWRWCDAPTELVRVLTPEAAQAAPGKERPCGGARPTRRTQRRPGACRRSHCRAPPRDRPQGRAREVAKEDLIFSNW